MGVQVDLLPPNYIMPSKAPMALSAAATLLAVTLRHGPEALFVTKAGHISQS